MQLTIALAKGRLAKFAIELFEQCGLDVGALRDDTRKLVIEQAGMRFIFVKPADVPVYVYRGVADIGIAGKDTLLEAGLPLYEMLDLKYAKCKISVAGYADRQQERVTSHITRVATKYPRVAKMYYDQKGEGIEIIKLNGSIELAPILDLSDVIVDIVESGNTIRENGLCVLEDVCEVSARLVVNQVSLKTKSKQIKPLIEKMKTALEEI